MAVVDARYVSLVTYRRSGEAVPVPVWIAPLADGRAGFTTDGRSGKVKRIRNDGRVLLRPCDLRGNVADDAEEVAAHAEVVTAGPDLAAVEAAVGRKYGIQFRLIALFDRLKTALGRFEHAAVVLTFED